MNAVESMPHGGPIEIELRTKGPRAIVMIRDQGPGIPAGQHEQVFRLHYTTKPGGSGIGLFMSRATIEAMGGTLTLQSSAMTGTTARIELPIAVLGTGKEILCSMS
ncbi:MAG: sensor histidine kinase [Planctomycetota bacterium]